MNQASADLFSAQIEPYHAEGIIIQLKMDGFSTASRRCFAVVHFPDDSLYGKFRDSAGYCSSCESREIGEFMACQCAMRLQCTKYQADIVAVQIR